MAYTYNFIQDRSHRQELRLWLLTTISRLPVTLSAGKVEDLTEWCLNSNVADSSDQDLRGPVLQLLCEQCPQQV